MSEDKCKKKFVSFGEIMLRLSPPGYLKIIQSDSFDVCYGGGESNVAVSLANYGVDAYFVSKLPENDIGQSALNYLRRYGVNTKYISRGGERLGIYFLETGASMRASRVIYDRANTSISKAEVKDFDFERIFSDADWFHFTGITPALSESSALLIEEVLKVAKSKGVKISVDLNYRKKLWTPEKAKTVMTNLMKYVDICIGNEEDIEKTLGFKIEKSDIIHGKLDIESYKSVCKKITEKFGFEYVATSLRKSFSASDNGWSGLIYNGKDFYSSKEYKVRIVDRVGGGDSFAGGLIYSLLSGKK